MNNIKPELQKLINDRFNEAQKSKVEQMMKYEKDRFIVDYSILIAAIQDDLVSLKPKMAKEFYNVENLNCLSLVDIMIARIIITLTEKLSFDVKKEFEKHFTLDKSQPELLYLIKLIDEQYYK